MAGPGRDPQGPPQKRVSANSGQGIAFGLRSRKLDPEEGRTRLGRSYLLITRLGRAQTLLCVARVPAPSLFSHPAKGSA